MFSIQKISRFERDVNRLVRKNREVVSLYEQALTVLEVDPYNISRQYRIKKLSDVKAGEGQWRLTVGRYRIRYDIKGKVVELHSFKPRPDAYKK